MSYNFEQTINMTPTPIYSIYKYKNEVWFGGEDILLFHDVEKDYWRTLSEENIGYVSKIKTALPANIFAEIPDDIPWMN